MGNETRSIPVLPIAALATIVDYLRGGLVGHERPQSKSASRKLQRFRAAAGLPVAPDLGIEHPLKVGRLA